MKYEAARRLVRWTSFLVVLAFGGAVAHGGRSVEQLARVAVGELECIELRGFVHDPAGAPAEGAVVVSSAGGKTLTDGDGAYRLVVRVPLGTHDVQVTAVGAGGLVASTSTVLSAASRWVQVAPLALALGNSCSPSWLPTFRGTGTNDFVAALATYDDGDGPALYAGGHFTGAGGQAANRIAKWDGSSWKPLGDGLNATVTALAVHDDGSGPALFAGGYFTTAGGAPAPGIARWNGTTWSALGSGVSGGITALIVHDDGGGPALYAGGSFTVAGGVPANGIARWNGASWSALGAGRGGTVWALAVHDAGSGPALYVGGGFTTAGGAPASRVARWNGASWSALGSGLDNNVYTLAVYDGGSGAALYAGGAFSFSGGLFVENVVRWTGASWVTVGGSDGIHDRSVRVLRAFNDGSGSKLYAGGDFFTVGDTPANRFAAWNGTSWQSTGTGMEGGNDPFTVPSVMSLCAHDDGDGPALFVGGRFAIADGVDVNNLGRRQGSSWSALVGGISAHVEALAVYDDGTGPGLYVGGAFATAGGVTVNHVGRWDGSSWTPLGSGTDGTVRALVVHDDGSGPALFAGGSFVHAGGLTVNNIAKWDGSSWSALDYGVSLGAVHALAVHDDGGGPALYAGGTFLLAGGAFGSIPVNRIAKWNGSIWDNLGTGVNTQGGIVSAVISHNDGSGQKLYIGGLFGSVGEVVVPSIARWNGSVWGPVGDGLDGPVEALLLYNGALVASGAFDQSGQAWLSGGIGRWNGSSWFAFGNGPGPGGAEGNTKFALAVHDDGTGAKLHAGTWRWNGASWSRLGNGAKGPVFALASFDDGNGSSLFAGGQIVTFVDTSDSFLGKWGCDRLPPEILAPPVHVIDRPGDGYGEVVTFSVEAHDNHDPAPEIWYAPPSGTWLPQGTTMILCAATDASGNQSFTEFPVTVQLKVQSKKP